MLDERRLRALPDLRRLLPLQEIEQDNHADTIRCGIREACSQLAGLG